MRSLSSSPSRTNFNTTRRSRAAEDSPQGAPTNPANADDQNAPDNPSATRADQAEARGRSSAGDGETSQPESSVPATAANPTDALPAGQELPLGREELRRLLEDPQANPSMLSDATNLIATFQSAPPTGQTEAQHEDATPYPQSSLRSLLERDLPAARPQPATPIETAWDQLPMGYAAIHDQSSYAVGQSQAVAQQRRPFAIDQPQVESSRLINEGPAFPSALPAGRWLPLDRAQSSRLQAYRAGLSPSTIGQSPDIAQQRRPSPIPQPHVVSPSAAAEPLQRPANAERSTTAVPAERLVRAYQRMHQSLAEQPHLYPAILSSLSRRIAALQGAPRTGQTEAQSEDATLNAEGLSNADDDLLGRSPGGFPGVHGSRPGYASPAIATTSRDRPLLPARQDFAYHVLGQPSRLFLRRHGDPSFASGASGPHQQPAPAGNPTRVLSEKLHLGQGFCESPEWQYLAKTQDLALLSGLVTTALRTTKNPNLEAMLRRLVEEMVRKPALAERVFVVLVGADESCGDRVSLALSRAEEELLAQPVWEGALNHNLTKVIEIARQVFRRRLVEELAKQKVEDINKVRRAASRREHTEDVETLLAFLAGLHGPLELGGEKPDAQFTDVRVSGVTLEDISIAKQKVLTQEGDQGGKRLWDFIASWEPWQRVVLPAHFPDEVARIEQVLSNPERPARLEREAATEVENANVPIEYVSIEFRQDHITRRANQLGRDEELQHWLSLTERAWSPQ